MSKNSKRKRSSKSKIEEQLEVILSRLNALESSSQTSHVEEPAASLRAITAPLDVQPSCSEVPPSVGVPEVPSTLVMEAVSVPPSTVGINSAETMISEVTDKLVTAINAMNPVRSNHIYISSFDPSLHDFEVWCSEVDHVRNINKWDERECLARIGNCLKGDARVWLNEWTTNDRSWSNFKREFHALCPRRLDIAEILFDVMKTDSDKYPTYAEYARRSLLRLRIVVGLSEELISMIVIRGITDPHIRAAAANAKLLPDELVSFLSIYVKPKMTSRLKSFAGNPTNHKDSYRASRKREFDDSKVKCYQCGEFGHRQNACRKRFKLGNNTEGNQPSTLRSSISNRYVSKSNPCTFCKKPGHKEEDCFAKQRVGSRGNQNVNFCREVVNDYRQNDIAAAVIQE